MSRLNFGRASAQKFVVWATAAFLICILGTPGHCIAQDSARPSLVEAAAASTRPPAVEQDRPSAHPTRLRRNDADYSLAFIAGIGAPALLLTLGYLPLLASDTLGPAPRLWLPVGIAAAGALAGVAVIWAAPFSRSRANYRLQAGLTSVSLLGQF
jgi:hypothetical protein